MRTLVGYWRSRGMQILAYLDDWSFLTRRGIGAQTLAARVHVDCKAAAGRQSGEVTAHHSVGAAALGGCGGPPEHGVRGAAASVGPASGHHRRYPNQPNGTGPALASIANHIIPSFELAAEGSRYLAIC